MSVAAFFIVAAAGAVSARLSLRGADASTAPQSGFADFVEAGFPFIVSTVDAREVGPSLPGDNVATRGVVLMLGDSTYAVFDPDLLRMAIAWRGDFISLTAMAQISYQDSLNKNNQIPKVLGRPLFATGLYPGWTVGEPDFTDPRAPGPYPEDPGRGPLDPAVARWEGLYVAGDRAVLAYTVGGTEIRELPGRVGAGEEVGVVRTFRTGATERPLSLVVAEWQGQARVDASDDLASVVGAAGDSMTAIGLVDAPAGVRLRVVDERHAVVELPAGTPPALFRVVVWRGPAAARDRFRDMLAGPTEMIDFASGGPPHWEGSVTTSAELAPDTAAYVVDEITLPVVNPWRRNIRPSDIAFFSDGRAAVSTYEGDVWIVSGLTEQLDRLEWRRFASGLYEPMSLEIVDDQLYLYSRSGLTRPRDLNGDGEADFYENFSDLSVQTLESREFPLSMGTKPGGGFYLSRGGALDNGPRTSPAIMPGFRAGSAQSGTVMELSADGRTIRTFASGLREPFIGVHPERGIVTASDQQGNFVPSTPIYRIEEGAYYGVPATAHREDLPEAEEPITWIPHEVDQSGAGQAWITGESMGFADDALMHVSYGRPGVFRIYFDEAADGGQGAAISLSDDFAGPLLKGEMRPQDGQLYVAGFQIWGTRSSGIRTLARVRYTGLPNLLPEAVSAGEQGVMVRFGVPLDPSIAADASRYRVARWDYRRTERYGSGHFRPDGEAGEEPLRVAGAHLSRDGRTLLLVLPEMMPVDQLQVAYDLRAASGAPVTDTLYLTVNEPRALNLTAAGFGEVDWRAEAARALAAGAESEDVGETTAARGQEVFERVGCVACHSVDGTTAGKLGPTLQGVFGSSRELADGSTVQADEAYLQRAIEEPGAHIVAGYQEGMPAYLGVLSSGEIESLVMYIRSLRR